MPISVGSVEVDILPNAKGIYARLRDQLVPPAARAGADAGKAAGRAFGPAMAAAVDNSAAAAAGERIGRQISARITAQIRGSLRDGITQGGTAARPAATRQGDDTAGAFARAMRARLTEAFRAMPRLDVRISDTGVDAELARLRARMETLSNKRIGIDVDVAAADAEVADISERLRRLGAVHPNVAIRADVAQARAALAEVRAQIDLVSARPGQIRLETDGSFGARLRAAVQGAEAALPNINVGVDTSEADAQVASLRAQLTALRDQRIGIDVDAATARARVDEIRSRLIALGASSPDIAVRVDTAAAAASLARVEAMADALDGKNVDLHVSNRQALSAILQVAVAMAALTAIPAIPVMAAGAGSLVSAFTAAGVGVGVFAAAAIPAVTQIKAALDAQKQAQQAANTATAKGGQTAAQAASRALQLAGAEAALASAQRNGARQVQQAKQALGQAVEQAAQRQQQADRAVTAAEKALTASQKTARQAQLDLVAARKTAADQLLDLNNQEKDAELAQRRAILQVREAQAQLDADKKAGSAVSADQLAQDQLAYDEAVQALSEQRTATKRLQDQTAAANKAGVSGSQTVLQAQQALAQAKQDVADKTQALADARADQSRTEVQNAQSIADARAKIADAEASAADSIASAQRQLQSASLAGAKASDASATAAQKYQQALDKLSPSARGTFNAFLSLRSGFTAWSKSLQPAVMPIFTRALNGVKNSLPGLTPIVLGAASGIEKLQDRVSRGFKSPWWRQLKKDFAASVEPAISRAGTIIGNIFIGTAGIIDAFLPHLRGVSNESDSITRRFANFGKNLKVNPKFNSFLHYAADESPKLGDAFGKIGTALLDWSKAVAPLSGPLLTIIGAMASGVSAIATNAPGALQLIYAIFLMTKLATLAQLGLTGALLAYRAAVILVTLVTEGWTAAQLAADAAFDANPIVAVILIILAAVGLMVAGILYAWNHWAWFRDSVTAVWQAIQDAALWTWRVVLKPTFDAIAAAAQWLWTNAIKPAFDGVVAAFQAVAGWAVWLWQNVIGPVFAAIGAIISWWWTNIVQRYFALVRFVFLTWIALVLFFYNQAIKPVFVGIGDVFTWWWNNVVRRYFNMVMAIIRTTGDVFSWLWTNAVRPVFGWIGDRITWVWTKSIKPAFDSLKTGVKAIGTAFSDTKDAIGKSWDEVRDATKKPINFVLDTVWNKGIVSAWTKIGGWIPGLPKLGKLPLLAAGGTLPVRPGVFNRPTAIVGEGNPRHPEFVIPTDPQYRTRALDLWRQAGSQMLFGGGIIGDIGGAAKKAGNVVADAGSAAWSGIRTAGQFLKDPVGNLVKMLDPVLRKISGHFTDTAWGKLAAALPKQAVEGLKHLVGIGSGPSKAWRPSSGVAQWAPTILQALALLGQPPSWLTTVEHRMNQESGGNPTIVNKWDSNWLRGTPSVGLMQVIGPTFRSYAGRFRNRGPFSYGVSTDPLANIFAGLNYATHRYGSLSALNRPGGYDSGGYLQPGLNLAYNGTGRPEPVFTTQQANALTRTGGTGGGPASFEGALYLDSGEFLGRVRGEAQQVVAQNNGTLLTALNARPRR